MLFPYYIPIGPIGPPPIGGIIGGIDPRFGLADFFARGAAFLGAGLAPLAMPNNAAIPIALPLADAIGFLIIHLYLTLFSRGFFFFAALDALRVEDARIAPADLRDTP